MDESIEATLLRLDAEANDAVQTWKDGTQILRKTKWTTTDPVANKVYFNYGTMLDFFDYSGVRV